MKKRFKEIRVFCGNECVGHHFFHIEFVIDNKNYFQEMITKLSESTRIHLSRSKTGEYVFDPYDQSSYFIKGLQKTKFSGNSGATIYDEACLLAQDYTNRRSGINYIKDEDNVLTIEQLIDLASCIYFKEEEINEIAEFKKKCLEAVCLENQSGQVSEKEQ